VDSEKFDKVVLDLLYDELDELTRASAHRHMEQSARAKALYSELRATREVGLLPLVEPPESLERRILDAEERARAGRPLRQRFGTFVSIVASYAMRPQLGMAALLLLMLGSSLLLLRVKPGEPSSVQVTERGVPESERETVAVVPVPAPEPNRGETSQAAPRALARSRAAEAPRSDTPEDKSLSAAEREKMPVGRDPQGFDRATGAAALGAAPAEAPAAGAGLSDEAAPPLDDARREAPAGPAKGCASTLPHYEEVRESPPSPAAGYAATWVVAQCYRELGETQRARSAFEALLQAPEYAERAKQALAELPSPVAESSVAAAPPPKAAERTAKSKAGAAKAPATAASPQQ